MTLTIGLVANVYNEANALPGWLETHTPFFDDIRVVHAGPNGEHSVDGTIEILEKWRIPIEFMAIDGGFGVVRTKAVRCSPCDYVMILDADERFYPIHSTMSCHGESTPQNEVDAILQSYDFRDLKTMLPNWENVAKLGANLTVKLGVPYNQGEHLRYLIDINKPDAVVSIRRHWHDMTFRRPTQNWLNDPDWQMRIVRNDPSVFFDPEKSMHEQLMGMKSLANSHPLNGPFFDHFHFTFKKMEVEQRAHDVAIYNAIHKRERPPTSADFAKGLKV